MIVGCAKKSSTMRDSQPAASTAEPTPPPSIARDLDQRTRELREQVQILQTNAHQLPGRDDSSHRQIMQQVFADLTQTLPRVVGPDATGGFRQQLRILSSAQTQLASGSSDLAAEPTIDTGLRAAQNALASAQSRLFYESQPIAQTLEQLRGRISELDSVRGPMHRLVVTQSVDLITRTISQMADVMEARATGEEPAAAPAKEESKEAAPAQEAPKEEAPKEEPKEEAKPTEEPAPAEDAAAENGGEKPEEDKEKAAEGEEKPAEEAPPADGADMNK